MSYILDNNIAGLNPQPADPALTKAVYGLETSADSDFIGFTYNGVKSSDLGIVRTSDGSRFNENLLPTMSDKTVQVTGGDGTYYFGSYYTQRAISISFAFDHMSESQFRKLRNVVSIKRPCDLVLDEQPYKTWYAKITGTPTIKYVCFLEDDERIYKGEGTLVFTCYDAFAYTPTNKKFLYTHTSTGLKPNYDVNNTEEWMYASGILAAKTHVDRASLGDLRYPNTDFDTYQNLGYNIYNSGDKDSNWTFALKFPSASVSHIIPQTRFQLTQAGLTEPYYLATNAFHPKSYTVQTSTTTTTMVDDGIIFNSKTRLIEGVKYSNNVFTKTGTIYNDIIKEGDFFTIPSTKDMVESNKLVFQITQVENGSVQPISDSDCFGADRDNALQYQYDWY